MSESSLLRWTGHPLADVGVATLCAMAGKEDPATLTLEDLDAAGNELHQAYTNPIFVSYLSCVFTMNAPYTHPSMSEANREVALKRVLFPHRVQPDEGTHGLLCAFSDLPATHLLDRSNVPMVTGEGIMNFFPAGRTELAVAAPYVLALQALPLGGRRSEGKLLIVHCDHPRFTLRFAQRYLTRNRFLINLAKTNQLPDYEGPSEILDREWNSWDKSKKKPKYPDAKAPQSLVLDDLVEIVTETSKGEMARTPCSVTVYLLSNSGQGPSLEIEHIPGEFVAFLEELHGTTYEARWRQLVRRNWQVANVVDRTRKSPKAKKNAANSDDPRKPLQGPGRTRNELYDDLLAIFESGERNWQAAARFIRRHLLTDSSFYLKDPNSSSPPRLRREHLELIDWQLTDLFLRKVLGMNKERLESIRRFADRLAEFIDEHNDRRLFRNLVFTSGEGQYRALLTKVQRQYAHDRNALLFGFDEYLDLFLADDAGDYVSWSLVRDLISIRLVEQLFHKKFFDRAGNQDVLESFEDQSSVPVN